MTAVFLSNSLLSLGILSLIKLRDNGLKKNIQLKEHFSVEHNFPGDSVCGTQ